ncbi:MAG: nickel-dependent hydrogenase large subunit [Candidatus Heimdallarchaeota archaeon]|nr:nickel-dependent hydrogenase large subunit [Candidatus Heimdallarchaeota archaeon]
MTTTKIDLKHIARVEGYGRLVVDIENKRVKESKFMVLEGARFFEGIVTGKKYHEVPIIISRICAICSASHSVVSTYAIENALSIPQSEQTHLLRKLLVFGETLESHLLHLYYLALPDYVRQPSVLPLAASHPHVVKRAFFGHGVGNQIQRQVGGRAVHPIRNVIGGFTMFPSVEHMRDMRSKLPRVIADCMETIKLLKSLPDQPTINSERDYVAIWDPNEYAYSFAKQIKHGRGGPFPAEDYQKHLIEEIRPYSHTKFSSINGDSFMVGALPRLNLNHLLLTEKGKDALEISGLQLPDYDTYHNNMAQLIESVDVAQRSIEILDNFLANGFEEQNFDFNPKPGNGTAVTEAPRGLLVHQYTFDDEFRCNYCDVVTPTAYNQHKMETDCNDLIPRIADRPREDIELFLNMLIRAYDPCISCSAHSMKVDVIFK